MEFSEKKLQIITLLSDLGIKDTYVPIAKAQLFSYSSDLNIIDISNLIEEGNIFQASYLLLSAYNNFPKGTIHIVLMDIYTSPEPKLILAKKDNYFFIAPDNGILSIFSNYTDFIAYECTLFKKTFTFIEWMKEIIKVIEQLNLFDLSTINNEKLTLPYTTCNIKEIKGFFQIYTTDNFVECSILHIDRFQNIILNINKKQFEEIFKGRNFKINIARMKDITKINNNINDVDEGSPLCRFNEAGFLELAINHGYMATKLNLNTLKGYELHYKKIKIFIID